MFVCSTQVKSRTAKKAYEASSSFVHGSFWLLLTTASGLEPTKPTISQDTHPSTIQYHPAPPSTTQHHPAPPSTTRHHAKPTANFDRVGVQF
ncbi:hypothetical protein M5D96_005046 [Drosophila gunungcola]|uniref:Uncharacterized protein n=1 Tax=Drosophila gunungcola TaxID=103775 RepID=A0A9P9YVL7_9MUSC|nr:hypothetical protein M5D96_005046 [Drosophila gunungcola]